jgi:hypothetical protein
MSSDDFKAPKKAARWPDGKPILVMRPLDPESVLAGAKAALAAQDQRIMNAAMTGPAKFMGFLERGGLKIIDEKGNNPVSLQPGDFFTAPGDHLTPFHLS